MSMNIIIVTGVPGCGKTTVLNHVVRSRPDIPIINYGDVMLQEASALNIHRDAMRRLPLSQQQQIGLQAAKKIAQNSHPIIIVDTHAYIKTPLGYCPGIPLPVLNVLNPKIIAMIECSPSSIYERRHSDSFRNRDKESIQQIEYHQNINRSFLITCSALSSALFAPIPNDANPADSAQLIISLVDSLL